MTTASWRPTYISSKTRITRRRFLSGAAAGAGAAALIACGGSGSSVTLEKSIERTPGSVLYQTESYLWPDETKGAVLGGIYPDSVATDLTEGYDPYIGASSSTVATDPGGYEFLLRNNIGPGVKPGSDEANERLPNLASAYEQKDATTYVFTLRKGVKFHPVAPVNGREMNIEDWRSSLNRFNAVHPNSPNWKEVVDKVDFPDATTMVVKTKFPYFPFFIRMTNEDFSFPIMPKELNDSPELARSKIIGTGYRMLDKYQSSVTQEFKRYDDYWAGKAFIERWHRPIIPEAANRQAQFVAQNIISYTPSVQESLNVRQQVPQALMVSDPMRDGIPRAIFGKQDIKTAAWSDPRLRIAMHRVVDWPSILNLQSARDKFAAAGIEIETVFTTHVPVDPNYWLDPRKGELGAESANYLYDVAEAKKLATAAGFPNGFELPLVAQSRDAATDIWTLYHTEIAKSGVVKLQDDLMTDRVAYLDRTTRTAEFRGVQWFSGGSVHGDVDYVFFRNYHSSGGASAITDPKLDDLITKSREATDWDKRSVIIKDIQKEAAKLWPASLGEHGFATWHFEWPWLHNANQPANLQWLESEHAQAQRLIARLSGLQGIIRGDFRRN